ncbi:MAG: DUF1998 domain-containing protein [Patescibacteria group bacterium]
MSSGPIRRAQLIAPFGVGALVVGRDGVGLVSGGLDHWYEMEDGTSNVNPNEFVISEWRLQRILKVDHFSLPPDHRQKRRGVVVPNVEMTVPFLRFPQWHFCPSCKFLHKSTLTRRDRVKCPECEKKRKNSLMHQVPFVAMCDHGHLQDFPWREWVHRSAHPACNQSMRLIATGGATLAAQKVLCDCGAERSLAQITAAEPDGSQTYLSQNLDSGGQLFLCSGQRPWLGTEEETQCSRPMRGSLRSASNLYFAHIRSAIYVPRHSSHASSELVSHLENPPISTLIRALIDAGEEPKPKHLRNKYKAILQPYPDPELAEALAVIVNDTGVQNHENTVVDSDDPSTAFRREEFNILCHPQDEADLVIKDTNLSEYEAGLAQYFDKVLLIDKLKETRALAGFTRIFPDNDQSLDELKSMLWRHQPNSDSSWLPAYVVHGEGILVQFNERRLYNWEKSTAVQNRLKPLVASYLAIQTRKRLHTRSITPRFVLLHTFAHLIINRLTFECGYSSAALRERLFVSTDTQHPMAGVLIYTAAGDAEGTMGGLVRMGKPGSLESVIRRALEGARWCSADPVCMEIGSKGQGPDSCNLAACHNCALVPETACEEFNRFLDRGVVVGEPNDRSLGYFKTE